MGCSLKLNRPKIMPRHSYRHEEQCNAGTHQPAYRVGITCNHNLAGFLGGNAYTLFQTFVSAVVRFQEDGTQRRTQGQGVQSEKPMAIAMVKPN